jgi:hypothetical protein
VKLLFKLLSAGVSAAGGMLAGAIFTRLWKAFTGDEETPDAETEHSISMLLLAAVLQGALAGGIRALLARAGVRGLRSLRGEERRA